MLSEVICIHFFFSFKLFWGLEFETRSRVAQDSIELSMLPRMTLNS